MSTVKVVAVILTLFVVCQSTRVHLRLDRTVELGCDGENVVNVMKVCCKRKKRCTTSSALTTIQAAVGNSSSVRGTSDLYGEECPSNKLRIIYECDDPATAATEDATEDATAATEDATAAAEATTEAAGTVKATEADANGDVVEELKLMEGELEGGVDPFHGLPTGTSGGSVLAGKGGAIFGQ